MGRRKWFVLAEALGLALLLAAWVLDWSVVQSLSGASGRAQYSLDSAQDAFLAVSLKDTVQLEAAVTRACSGQALGGGPYANYASAWASPEVREAWSRRTSSELQNLRNLLLVLDTTAAKYHLPSTTKAATEHVSKLENDFSRIQAVVVAKRTEANVPTPSELGEPELRAGVVAAHSEIVALMNTTSAALADAIAQRSFPYQILFVIGSVGVVVARLADWWASRDLRGRKAPRLRARPAARRSREQTRL